MMKDYNGLQRKQGPEDVVASSALCNGTSPYATEAFLFTPFAKCHDVELGILATQMEVGCQSVPRAGARYLMKLRRTPSASDTRRSSCRGRKEQNAI